MRGEQLPDMDSTFSLSKNNKPCDGFVEVNYLGLKKCTSVVKQKNDIVIWNEVIDIPVSVPTVSQKIVFIVKDHDSIDKDDLIGSFEISVNDVLNDFYKDISIVNLYGAYDVKSNSQMANLMNTNA